MTVRKNDIYVYPKVYLEGEKISPINVFYYPDATVTCDERDRDFSEDCIRYPRLVVEVLSPSTEAFNRGGKFADYRTIETLQEYVLISQQQVSVECFRRNAEGLWVLYPYSAGEEIHLASIDFSCPIAALFDTPRSKETGILRTK